MNTRFGWFQLVGPLLASAVVAACSDDGSNGSNDDTNDEREEAGVDPNPTQDGADAGESTASTGTGATTPSSSSATNTRTNTSSSSTVGLDASVFDAGAPSDSSDEPGDDDEGTDDTNATNGTMATVTSSTSESTGIEDPTSEEVPETTGLYWDQAFFHGHAEPIGETTVLTLDDGQLCFSGNESGTVGFWYNVNQTEGGEAEPFVHQDDITGLNVDVATEGEYEMHFYADDTLYCSGVIEGGWRYFLWASFRDCTDLVSFYDGEVPLTTLRFTYLADGEFEVCLNRLESGRLSDAGVPFDAGGSDTGTGTGSSADASVTQDAGSADLDSGVDADAL